MPHALQTERAKRAQDREDERRALIAALLQQRAVDTGALAQERERTFRSTQQSLIAAPAAGQVGSAIARAQGAEKQQDAANAAQIDIAQIRSQTDLQKEQLKGEAGLVKAEFDAQSRMALEQFKIQGKAELESQKSISRADALNIKIQKREDDIDNQMLAAIDADAKGLMRPGELDGIIFELKARGEVSAASIRGAFGPDRGGQGGGVTQAQAMSIFDSAREFLEANNKEFREALNAGNSDKMEAMVREEVLRRAEQAELFRGGELDAEVQDEFQDVDFGSLPGPLNILVGLGDGSTQEAGQLGLQEQPIQQGDIAAQSTEIANVTAQLGLPADALTRALPSVSEQLGLGGEVDPIDALEAILHALSTETDPVRKEELRQQYLTLRAQIGE